MSGPASPPLPSFFGRRSGERDASSEDASGLLFTLESGNRIAHFTLLRFLARGGMGQVWEAWDESLRRSVALKFVLPERVDSKGLAMFAREARAGGRLHHPNIVTTLGYGTDQGLAWIAQELVEGSWTLKDYLDEARAQSSVPKNYYRKVAELVIPLADALHAAHQAGVIHRDVKPQNILIAPDDTPKLTDFGLARVSNDSFLSQSGDFAGTWAYMSPEQVAAKRIGMDHRTDVFSLGVVLYEMLALRRPFDGDSTAQIAARILFHEPPIAAKVRSQCPKDLALVCNKALEKSPAHRYSTALELAEDLQRYLDNEQIRARPPSVVRRTVKWSRRNPGVASTLLVGTSAFAVVSVLLIQRSSNLRDLAALSDRNAELAIQRAEQARMAENERDSVMRLSASQKVDDLVAEQALLWPPHPEHLEAYRRWLENAQTLIDGLPDHLAQRQRLRTRALVQTEMEREAERRSHPDAGRLKSVSQRLASARNALAVRRGNSPSLLPEVDRSRLPTSLPEWNDVAWKLVGPERSTLGREAEGLSIAMAALEEWPEAELSMLLDTIAWGRFALGDDAGAMEASQQALSRAQPDEQPDYQTTTDSLSKRIAAARSETGLRQAEAEISRLEAEVAELDERIEAQREVRYPEDRSEEHWWDTQLSQLIDKLESLRDKLVSQTAISPEFGWSVAKRLAFAQACESGFAPGGAYSQTWLRDEGALRAAYPGLEVRAQMGLVSLGPDPDSGLFEFAHLATGEPPVRGPDGRLMLSEDTGLVLVLIPAGHFWMGSQKEDPSARNFDPDFERNESPPHEIELSAYFISKFEMNQAQWLRACGNEPSFYKNEPKFAPTKLHPVEQVSWQSSSRVCDWLGLRLPSEAQWERAARAGTQSIWSFGNDREDVRGKINIADRSAAASGANWSAIKDWPDLEDGGIMHREGGTYPPNAFGLCELHGNVSEWCADLFGFYDVANRSLDPEVQVSTTRNRIFRGGGFNTEARETRSANRLYAPPESADRAVGLRPARDILK